MTYEAKRYISLENNELQELTDVFPTEVCREDLELVTWIILWDEGKNLQLFGTTKDGLAILQDTWEMKKNWNFSQTCRIAENLLEKKIRWRATADLDDYDSDYGIDIEDYYPFLVYVERMDWPYHPGREHDIYTVFWDGHNDFQTYSTSYFDEEDVPKNWFKSDVGEVLLDDTWSYYFDDIEEGEIPDRKRHEPSDYFADPEKLLNHRGAIASDIKWNSSASASDVLSDPTTVSLGLAFLAAIPIGIFLAIWLVTKIFGLIFS